MGILMSNQDFLSDCIACIKDSDQPVEVFGTVLRVIELSQVLPVIGFPRPLVENIEIRMK